jgi:long-chain fatty acid transport protein
MIRNFRASIPATTLAFLLAAALAPRASASGFQLRDQSGSGQGNAYAGISAGGSDVSSMFFNPAAMIRFDGNHLQFGLTEIMPDSRMTGGSASQPGVSALNIPSSTISGATSTGNVASSATLPTIYAMWSVDPDLKLGLSVNVPFGLTTEYDPSWAGRYHGIKSHLQTLDITPAIAYRLAPKFSVGGAFVARRASAQLSQAVDGGYTAELAVVSEGLSNSLGGQPILTSGAADADAYVSGHAWAYGYKLGMLYEPNERLHFGLGYQSAIRETIKGDASFSTPSPVPAVNALNAANPGAGTKIQNIFNALGNATRNCSASAVLDLPATWSLGAIWDLSGTFSLGLEVDRTIWSSFHELRVKFATPGVADSVTEENWKDSTFVALGGTCHPQGPWTYRLGLAIDKTPVLDSTRTPRIPDADRTWASLGVSYQFTPAFGMDAGYTHLFCKDSTVNLSGNGAPDDEHPGNLTGTYKNSIDVLALQARYKF